MNSIIPPNADESPNTTPKTSEDVAAFTPLKLKLNLPNLRKLRSTFLTLCAILVGVLLAWLVIAYSHNMATVIATGSSSNDTDSIPFGLSLLKSKSNPTIRTDSFCAINTLPNNSCLNTTALCDEDLRFARIAWKYFENNYNPKTGLYNAADNYNSTTMWDTGSALAATIAARDFGFIDDHEFDGRIQAMLATLNTMQLFDNAAPNKAYNTLTAEMVDYGNKPSADGIGASTLDLARLTSWLNALSCLHPKYAYSSQRAIQRWDFKRMIKDGQMYGMARDPVNKQVKPLQEGRLGYEQYGGKVFQSMGFDQHVSARYNNEFASTINILGIPIAYDTRDPRELGAYNYVVSESFIMDAVEHGFDEENKPLMDNIYAVQKRRFEETGIVTAVSEDNIDRKPWFLYNTIFTAGLPWNTITDKGQSFDNLKATSTKAAIAMAALYPNDSYSKELTYSVSNAYDPERGWYSGVYENGLGYNKARTANTNGIIMSVMLYKKYGSFYPICRQCQRGLKIDEKLSKPKCTTCAE